MVTYLHIERAPELDSSSESPDPDPIEPRGPSSVDRLPGSVEFGSVAVPSSEPLPLSLPVLELPPNDPSSGSVGMAGKLGLFVKFRDQFHPCLWWCRPSRSRLPRLRRLGRTTAMPRTEPPPSRIAKSCSCVTSTVLLRAEELNGERAAKS